MIAPALLACAPNVAPVTLQAVIQVESGGNPLAINVNGIQVQPPRARDSRDATRIAESYIARGYSVDIGLMQVNSRNLLALGTTVERMLEPCANIHAGATILTAGYAEAARARGEGQVALQAALSAYNTGDFYWGFVNGYVARYYGPNGVSTPTGGVRAAAAKHVAPAPPHDPYTADTTVFARKALNVRIE